jgi:hypothetical protein
MYAKSNESTAHGVDINIHFEVLSSVEKKVTLCWMINVFYNIAYMLYKNVFDWLKCVLNNLIEYDKKRGKCLALFWKILSTPDHEKKLAFASGLRNERLR